MPMNLFMPEIRVEGESFKITPIDVGDRIAAMDHLRLNDLGFHLKALRRLPLLWLHALHHAGGMQIEHINQMMALIVDCYNDFPWPHDVSHYLGDRGLSTILVSGHFDANGIFPGVSLWDLYVLGHFTFGALHEAGFAPALHHVFGGRFTTRIIAGKEVLGIEEIFAGSAGGGGARI